MGINQDQIHISVSSILQWLSLKSSLSLQALELKFCTHFSSFMYVLLVPFILSSVNLLLHVRHNISPCYSNFTAFLSYQKHNLMLTFHGDWRSYKLNFKFHYFFYKHSLIIPNFYSQPVWLNTVANLITVRHDTTYSVYYMSVGSSTCFGCWHPSSGAHTTVITASGID